MDKNKLINWLMLSIVITIEILMLSTCNQINQEHNSISNTYIPKNSSPIIIQLTNPNNNIEIQSTFQISFTITENGSSLDSVWYNWDSSENFSLSGTSPFNILSSGLEEGNHILNIFANTSAEELTSQTYNFIIDDTAPEMMINSYLEQKNGNNLTIVASDQNTIKYVKINWDDGSNLTLSNPPYIITIGGLGEGSHDLNYYAEDNASNIQHESKIIIIDETSPNIVLYSNTTVQNGEILNFGVTDLNSIHQVKYNWEGGINFTLNFPYNLTVAQNSEGNQTLNVFAWDLAGNLKILSFNITIDNPPTITLNAPKNNSGVRSGTIIDLEIVDVQSIGIITYNWDNGVNITLNSPFDITISGLDENSHILNVNAKDEENKTRNVIFNFIIDNTRPNITLEVQSIDLEIQPDSTVYLNIEENNTISTIKYNWDAGQIYYLYTPYDITVTDFSEGIHTLYINAEDNAGNFKVKVYEFIIDGTEPVINLISPDEGFGIVNGEEIELNIFDVNTIDLVKFNWNNGINHTLEDPYKLNYTESLGEQQVFYVFAIDKAGNMGFEYFNFSADQISPIISLINMSIPLEFQANELFSIEIQDPLLETVMYRWSDGFFVSWDIPYQLVLPESEGNYTLYVFANDSLGNQQIEVFSIIVDNTAPVISLMELENGCGIQIGDIISLRINETNTINNVSFSWNDNTNQILVTPFDVEVGNLDDGTNFLNIFAQDKAGNLASEFFNFFLDLSPPIISLVDLNNDSVIQSYTIINISVIEPNLESVKYLWDNQTVLIPWNESYKAIQPQGEYLHKLYVIATDHAGKISNSTFFFTTDDTPPTIQFENLDIASKLRLAAGSSIKFEVLDSNNISSVFYNWDGEENITLNITLNGLYTIIMIEESGDHTLNIYSTDEAGNMVIKNLDITTKKGPWLWIGIGGGFLSIAGTGGFYILKKKKIEKFELEQTENWLKKRGYKVNEV